IAALIVDADRYLLATYFQENLKYVRPSQFVEIAFNLYPGQIYKGHVDSIWKANGKGQYLLSDEIPKYEPPPPTVAQGVAAIYVDGDNGSWAALRKIAIHSRTWLAWLYPLNL